MTTLTVRCDCPSCGKPIRLPLMKGEDEEGRFLSVSTEALEDHAKGCEVNE